MTVESKTIIILDDAETRAMTEALKPGESLRDALMEAITSFRAKVVNHQGGNGNGNDEKTAICD